MSSLSKQEILAVLNHSKLELSGGPFSEEAIVRFQEFCAILQKWNGKINLTSEKDALSILEKHVFDSLQYVRWLDASHKTLDVGSGAGFPGIPIAIIHPDLDLTLMESQRKRCSFLREAVRSLNLKHAEVVEGRAENFSKQTLFSERFDRVCFRGFSSLDSCLDVGFPFLKAGGRIILKKGADELPSSSDSIPHNARIISTKEVEGLEGKTSLMMVIEKCST
jgi:16S rRNA (guanine527-N7)-methyltransferase